MNERRPGQWPVDNPADLGAPPSEDELYMKRQQEKALREMCLGSIQHDLEQQPTASSAQAKARVWCAQILAIAEDVAAEKRKAA
ncbi:hypothetical protein QR97_12830 [Streptomyces sp. PBH53]|uniref:hypothetical protein n=1 Tax=Streptomyces sp. PBH53 TaxID=1577075 RepID=UPI000655B260|nr:hypothetical protein [Streptomyces sp. PBH53]AKN70595.1 hypothetical protein QR97_12830 [Streptomyces sp. PBH53]